MYTAAKVFVVIGMIAYAISGLTMFPLGIILSAVSIIVGVCAMRELQDEFRKPSTAVSVLALLFCGLIAGIIMLCIPASSAKPGASTATNLQCTKCGKTDASVRYYTVSTALGKMNRPYCPECKALVDQENQK